MPASTPIGPNNGTAVFSDILKYYEKNEMANMIAATMDTFKEVSIVAGQVIPIVLIFHLLIQYTKIVNEGRFEWIETGKMVLLLLFFWNYAEVMGAINLVITHFTDGINERFDKWNSGHSLNDKIKELCDMYKEKHPTSVSSIVENFADWIVASCTNLIILIARTVTYAVRDIMLCFLFIVGPIAIVVGLIPGFEGNIQKWFKYYVAVSFWAVTLCILDIFLYNYVDACIKNKNVDGTITVNVTIALMYLMAPYLTGRYIAGEGSNFMSKMVQAGAAGGVMGGKLASSAAPAAAGVGGVGMQAGGKALEKLGNKGNFGGLSKMGKGMSDFGKGMTGEKSMGGVLGNMYKGVKQKISKNSNET